MTRRPYPTDLSNEEYACIEPYLPLIKPVGRPRTHTYHEILDAVFYKRRFSWQRTKRSVSHKRKDPDLQASKEAEPEVLKKSGPQRGD